MKVTRLIQGFRARGPAGDRPAEAGVALAGCLLALALAGCGNDADLQSSAPAPAPAGTTGGPAAANATGAGAASTPAPAPQTEAVIQLINEKRAVARQCGNVPYPAVPPVSAQLDIEEAATAQSQWMQQNMVLTHVGANGSDPGRRLTDAGYAWSAVGENVAAGYDSVPQTLDAWLASPPHCANIMSADFTQVGYSFLAANARTVAYATLVLAAPLVAPQP